MGHIATHTRLMASSPPRPPIAPLRRPCSAATCLQMTPRARSLHQPPSAPRSAGLATTMMTPISCRWRRQASWRAASSHGLLNGLNAVESAALLAARDRQRLVRLWLQERLISANVIAEDVLR